MHSLFYFVRIAGLGSASGLAAAHRLTAAGIFRTLAPGTAANRARSSARDAVTQVVKDLVSEVAASGSLALVTQRHSKRQRRAA